MYDSSYLVNYQAIILRHSTKQHIISCFINKLKAVFTTGGIGDYITRVGRLPGASSKT